MTDDTKRCDAKCKDGSPCQNYPLTGRDKCRMHAGTSSDGSSHEGNTNAVDVGAWAEDFYQDFLTEAEKDRIHESAQALRDEATAQEIASHAASVCLEQFRRTGDERFMRRYESICDTFGLAPADEVEVGGDLTAKLQADGFDMDFGGVDE